MSKTAAIPLRAHPEPPAYIARTVTPAPKSSGFPSIAAMYLDRVRRTPDKDAFYYPDTSGTWQTLKWSEVHARVKAWASGLRALGLQYQERIAILSQTRYEWVIADLAVLCAGGATTTIYPSSTPDECTFILADSETKFVFVEDASQVKKLVEQRANLPNVAKVITLTNGTTSTPDHEDAHTVNAALTGYVFEKTAANLTSGANPTTTAAPGDRLRYTLRLRTTNEALTGFRIVDDLDALNAAAAFVPGTLALVTSPAGADSSGTSNTGGSKGTVVTRADAAQRRGSFRALRAAYPVLRSVAALDTLLFLQPGYKLIAEAVPS